MSTGLQDWPASWVVCPIENLLAPLHDGRTIHQGWSPQCEKHPSGSEAEWGVLKTTAIQDGVFLPEHNKLLPVGLDPRPLLEVNEGDLLLTCAGPRARCGVACLVRSTRARLMISGKMYRFRADGRLVLPDYLEAYLRARDARDNIDRMKTGISDSGLNLTQGRFRPLPVRVAPLQEQHRIVAKIEELFSELDAGVAALERAQAKLERYRASVLKAAVEGKLTEQWRKENPPEETGEELLGRILDERRKRWEEEQLVKFESKGAKPPKNWKEKYKEPLEPDRSELPELPEGWCWGTINQVSSRVQYGSSSKTTTEGQNGVPVLRMGNIQDGHLDLTALKYLPTDHSEFPELLLTHGDLLFNRTNSAELVGKSAVYHGEPVPCSFASYLIRVQLIDGSDADFVSYCLNSTLGRAWAARVVSQQVGQANINGTKLRAFAIPVPPVQEQLRIVSGVAELIAAVRQCEADVLAGRENGQALSQSILKRAFEGRLIPQDSEDEPASVLLERIRAEREAEKPKKKSRTAKPKVEQGSLDL